MHTIKLHDLKRISDHIQKDLDTAYRNTLDEGIYLRGKSVEVFEQAWAKYCGAEDCATVTSGSDALHTAALVLGIQPGDEIVCCSHSYIATIEGFLHQGADIKWVDSKTSDYCIDEDKIEEQITDKTRAIVWTDINGQGPDIDKIVGIAKKHNLLTVKDSAHTAGSRYKNKTIGHKDHQVDITCFSFGPVKNLGAIGGGGAITGTKDICDKVRQIRNHGRKNIDGRYNHTMLGFNRNIHTLQASFLLAKLPHLDTLVERKRQHAEYYNENLKGIFNVPVEQVNQFHSYHLYSILTPHRNQLQKFLKENNIETLVHWPKGLQEYPHTPDAENDLPVTQQITSQTLSLPCHPFMTEQELKYVIEKIKQFHAA